MENIVLYFARLNPSKGKLKGYDWLIRDTGLGTCAYVRIPENHPWFSKTKSGASNAPSIPVDWGATFYEYFAEPNQEWGKGCWIGWDYMHYNSNRYLTEEEVMDDIKAVIKVMEEQ